MPLKFCASCFFVKAVTSRLNIELYDLEKFVFYSRQNAWHEVVQNNNHLLRGLEVYFVFR